MLNEDETQSYLLGPYNISDIEFCSDQTIKKVEIDSWGKINFFYASYNAPHPYPWILLINDEGDILYHFMTEYQNASEVKEIIIEDMTIILEKSIQR